MYSQNNEEKYILEHCPPSGNFLDIGAYDGKKFSNTYALVERGWAGVCLEPDPENFRKLSINHANNPQVALLPLALGLTSGKMKFYACGDGIATSDNAHRLKWQKHTKYQEIEVESICFAHLTERFPDIFHFVNLDVEGQNLAMLKTLDLNQIGCRVFCIEHETQDREIKAFLGPEWRQVYRSDENLVFVR